MEKVNEQPAMSEKMMDAERVAFEAWYLQKFFEGDKQCGLEWLSTEPCGGYRHAEPAHAWLIWQARASLPVGVPDGYRLIRTEHFDAIKAQLNPKQVNAYRGRNIYDEDKVYANWSACASALDEIKDVFQQVDWDAENDLPELLAAPTVKAEQVDDRAECIADGLSVGMSQEEAEEFADKIAAPSLPAAGLAVPALDSWVAFADALGLELRMSDALWENARKLYYQLRAALSAQQSAPERVSVPMEFEPDRSCEDADGCPTELAVLKRFWREHMAQELSGPIREAIKWADHLLFECGALTHTRAPSVHVYNKTFAAVEIAKALLASHAEGGKV